MATKIKGDTIILYVWDSAAYRPIACLTSNSISETQNIIESQTKCDPGTITKEIGTYNYEISCEGEYIDTTSLLDVGDLTKASYDYLRTIMTSKVDWKMDTGLTTTAAFYGTAILSDLSLDAAAGETSTFSATLSGDGLIVTTDPHV